MKWHGVSVYGTASRIGVKAARNFIQINAPGRRIGYEQDISSFLADN
jgi:hypothetical protein